MHRRCKLPAPARIVEEAVVGPSLGREAISAGLWSFIIAFTMVLLFMIFYYNRAGWIADLALVTNIFFLFGVLASLGAVLTLPGIAGIKDSSGNMIYFRRLQILLKDHPDFTLLMGREELLAETVLLGGHGGVCGGANLLPELYVGLYNAACAKDLQKIEVLHEKVMKLSSAIYTVGQYESSYLKGIKCALSCMGICSDFMAEPFHRFRQEEHNRIQQYVQELGIAPEK